MEKFGRAGAGIMGVGGRSGGPTVISGIRFGAFDMEAGSAGGQGESNGRRSGGGGGLNFLLCKRPGLGGGRGGGSCRRFLGDDGGVPDVFRRLDFRTTGAGKTSLNLWFWWFAGGGISTPEERVM